MSYTKNALHSPYKRIKGTPNTRQYRKTEVLRKKEEKCSQRQTTWPETRSKQSNYSVSNLIPRNPTVKVIEFNQHLICIFIFIKTLQRRSGVILTGSCGERAAGKGTA